MLEYLFFHKPQLEQFIEFLNRHVVDYRVEDHEVGYTVGVPEGIDDETGDAVDHEYERLLQAQGALAAAEEGGLVQDVAGVGITLADGTPCTLRIDPELMSRMLDAISLEELRDLMQSIASQMENPDNRPLCHP